MLSSFGATTATVGEGFTIPGYFTKAFLSEPVGHKKLRLTFLFFLTVVHFYKQL